MNDVDVDATGPTSPNRTPAERLATTQHQVTIRGVEVSYAATAGTYGLLDGDGTPKASIFHTAYTRDDVVDPSERPVAFIFNGGPGAASVWLHLGVFGPRRVDVANSFEPAAPPYRFVDNEHSILDVCDLVFIDPMSTGLSRPHEGVDVKEFYGLDEDARWVSEFVRVWLSRNKRWSSPKFLAGESYGGVRASAMSKLLFEDYGIALNGVLLVSPALHMNALLPSAGNDLPYVMALPSYAATAWFQGKAPAGTTLEQHTAAAEDFALGEYASALLQGSRVSARDRTEVIGRMAELTGLDPSVIDRADLRVSSDHFAAELLRSDGKVVSHVDARFVAGDRYLQGGGVLGMGESRTTDPFDPIIIPQFTAAIHDYLQRELDFEDERQYRTEVRVESWPMVPARMRLGFPDVVPRLRQAMTANRKMRVFLATGYYDLLTFYLASEWSLDTMSLDPELRTNITSARYPGGHMMYIHDRELEQFSRDVVAFLAQSLPDATA